MVGLAGVIPGVFEGCVGGHGGQDCRCWLGAQSECSATRTRLSCVGSGACHGDRAASGVGAFVLSIWLVVAGIGWSQVGSRYVNNRPCLMSLLRLLQARTSLSWVYFHLRQACVFTPPGSLSSACTTPGSHLSIPEQLLGPLHAIVVVQERISLVRLPVWGASWWLGEYGNTHGRCSVAHAWSATFSCTLLRTHCPRQ